MTARVRVSGVVGEIDPRVYGGFVEHLGRHIYDGIHESAHPSADEEGFRTDVIALVQELGVTTIRYPGGNFVSGYRWEDGIGPRESRPRRLDLAWRSTETNQVGLHEFSHWLEKVGSDLMLAVNLGTRDVAEALDLLEYANVDADTAWTRERAANGRPTPFGVRMWCLGNEMDGPWQLGHRNAEDYGKLASRAAKAMRMLDPTIELVACGSSGRDMPTFGSWEREVLRHTFDDVDFISCHAYYQERGGEAQEFLVSAVDTDLFVREVVAAVDEVAAERGSDKRIMLSFDEWNVWYQFADDGTKAGDLVDDGWPVAPRLLEDQYNVMDAVVVGDLLITLLQHSDRVRSASLAQLVNVIAPIMTEPGGPAWRQTTFFPFSLTSRLGRGTARTLEIEGAPRVQSARFGDVSAVNAVATTDETGTSVFLANRSVAETAEVQIDLSALGAASVAVAEAWIVTDADYRAANTLAEPERVAPQALSVTREGDVLHLSLPPVAWAVIRLAD
ncbi:alpha-L-arabinofuranosidase [Microbacterium sp. VKM Ac-2870]|uniref:arabinosylfuranosidase ArfA n=1 Tax=Microbacterium sp. VKM Ac-2870 TaxID=2783825 RepID=UPI00188A0AA5|nr:alpha-L-arabinofuranosidase C-terminal domain-containing protein [Microbacterium sp. VKM Ac-2870]MBF4562165.1 alpha-L-arabinofuranosidase [Microbacterium sp. VKM Ac-2870]